MSRRIALEEALLPPLVALLLAAVVGDILILSFGQSPGAVYKLLLEGTWGNAYGFGQVLYKATTLVFTGLAVGLGLRAGLFNIGAESQLAAGGFCAAMIGMLLPAGIPALVCLPLFILAAALGGGVVGAVPGVLKARFGAHEVIVTIMLNFVVLALLNYLTSEKVHVPDTLHTPELRSGALPRFGDMMPAFHGSAANATILLAIIAAAIFGWYLFRTRRGFELRAVGLQPRAAEYAGVNVAGVTWRALAASGAIAGLGGLNYVLGYKHYYEEGFATGAGFLGIAVALVGRNHPVGIVLAALLFATLSQGGLAVNALVPKQMVDVLQAVVILAVSTSVPEVRRLLRECAAKRGAGMNALDFMAQTLRIAVPYLLAASAGVLSERAGLIGLTLEGYMLGGAFCAALGSYAAGAPWVGVLAAVVGGALLAALYATSAIRFRADQVVVGIAINLLAVGLTRFFLRLFFDSSSNSPRVPGFDARGAGTGFIALAQNPLVWIGVIMVPVVAWVLYRTPFGLRVRAVGEHPAAAASVGVPVARVRYMAVIGSGMIAGLAGAYLALDQHQFTDGMTAGRGFIALAATIFGRWDPLRAGLACLLFAAAETLQIQLQGTHAIPSQFIEMIPYVLTIIALAGVVGRAVPPAALGKTTAE